MCSLQNSVWNGLQRKINHIILLWTCFIDLCWCSHISYLICIYWRAFRTMWAIWAMRKNRAEFLSLEPMLIDWVLLHTKKGETTEMYFLLTFNKIPWGIQIDRWWVDLRALVSDRQYNVWHLLFRQTTVNKGWMSHYLNTKLWQLHSSKMYCI